VSTAVPGLSRLPRLHVQLTAAARRSGASATDAEDVVQEALIAAIAAGRADFNDAATARWLSGVVRNQARMAARGDIRRRRRESLYQQSLAEPVADEVATPAPSLDGLPPALRVVAALALSGHSRRDICWLLRISDTALRQRIHQLSRHLRRRGTPMPSGLPGLKLGLAYGRIRQALPPLLTEGDMFGTHDPDGHLFVIRRSQNHEARQQAVQPGKRSPSS
jgi:DNA-directed RNA polymerase specialized sigma24 family protein